MDTRATYGGAVNFVSSLSANPAKCSNTLKQYLSMLDHFVGLANKELRQTLFKLNP